MFDIFQGGGEGINELVRQLGQETYSVHIQDCHVIRQLACMDCNIQGGKKLVSGLKTNVTSQGFNESCFSCTYLKNNNYNISSVKSSLEFSRQSPHTHHSWYTPTRRRRGTPSVGAELEAGAAFCAVFQVLSESSSHVPSAISVGPPTGSHLPGPLS